MAELVSTDEFDFAVPELINEEVAESGLWMNLDIPALEWDFKVRYFDEYDTKTVKEMERTRKRRARELRVKELPNEENAKLMAFYALCDWRGIKNKEGKEVPFSESAMESLFANPKLNKIAYKIAAFAMKDENFDDVGEFDDAGN